MRKYLCQLTKRRAAALMLTGFLTLTGCGSADTPKPPAISTAPANLNAAPASVSAIPAKAPSEQKGSERLNLLLKAWADAGIKTELRNALQSNVINSMFGCIRHYEVFLNDRMVIVLEYDLAKLSSTAKRNLEYIEKNGHQSQNSEPAWKSVEFVLVNSASIIQNGEIVQKFKLVEHPDREKILAALKEFK